MIDDAVGVCVSVIGAGFACSPTVPIKKNHSKQDAIKMVSEKEYVYFVIKECYFADPQ